MVKTYHTYRRIIMREIDYNALLTNLNEMINTLEYDSMRSAGKAKLNSLSIASLYTLKEKYEKLIQQNSKVTPKKEVSIDE